MLIPISRLRLSTSTVIPHSLQRMGLPCPRYMTELHPFQQYTRLMSVRFFGDRKDAEKWLLPLA